MIRTICIFFLLLVTISVKGQDVCPIIPMPQSYTKTKGNFSLSANTVIVTNNQELLSAQLHFLQKEILKRQQIPLIVGQTESKSTIKLVYGKTNRKEIDAYALVINQNNITIEASSPSGIFNGIISLLQVTDQAKRIKDSLVLPACIIEDKPKYSWRGFMLDESRHFFGVEKVKQLLDWMAYYKLNRFHWHLTDEPAWRVEIKKYPLLTLVGGIGNFLNENAPAKYYTQEQINDIVAYAKERFITVIPEIDMPGHATAANRGYPEFSGGGSEKHPEFTFNPGKENTYKYLSDILREVSVLFPSGMIHLGGDEVSFGNQQWSNLPEVKSLMRREKIKDLKGVEQYFVERMADSLAHINNKTLAWDEVVDFNLRKDSTIIFWWRHDKPEQLAKTIEGGYQVVFCPRLPFYFDFVQDSTHNYGRKWVNKFNSLQNIYSYQLPKHKSVGANQILGVQANLWAETLENEDRLDYMIFPRITALAEVGWNDSSKRNDSEAFMKRVALHLPMFQKAELYYYNPFIPKKSPEPIKMKLRNVKFNTED